MTSQRPFAFRSLSPRAALDYPGRPKEIGLAVTGRDLTGRARGFGLPNIVGGTMRYSLICGSLALAALAADARTVAQSAPWCANNTFGGGLTCGYYNFEQCRQAIHGVGGSCMRNPREPEASEKQAPPARSRTTTTTREQPAEPRQPKVRQAAPRPERVRERPVPATPPDESPAESAAVNPARMKHDPPPVVAPPPETPPPRTAAAPASLPQLDAPRTLTMPAASGTVAATSPDAPPADRFFQARDLILAGKYQAGLSAMQALDKGDNADVAAYIGLAYNKLGRASESKTWYEKALAIDPNHLLTLAYFGMLRAEQGDVPNAQSYLDKIRGLCGGTGCYEYAALQAVIASKRR